MYCAASAQAIPRGRRRRNAGVGECIPDWPRRAKSFVFYGQVPLSALNGSFTKQELTQMLREKHTSVYVPNILSGAPTPSSPCDVPNFPIP